MYDGPTIDAFLHSPRIGGPIRAEGRAPRGAYPFGVGAPDAARGAWDHGGRAGPILGADALRPHAEGRCPAVAAAR